MTGTTSPDAPTTARAASVPVPRPAAEATSGGHAPTAEHASGGERGRAARDAVPRSTFGDFAVSASRPDPLAVLAAQDTPRVPELVPIRYGRMAVSPFTFYRGAAAVMAADLAAVPRTGITVQACGDAHLANFGFFASPERRLVFDINDFDETLPGPWEWDVKRLAASLEIAARDRGFTPEQRQQIVTAAGRTYREAMRQLAGMTGLDVWYAVAEVEAIRQRYHTRFSKTQRAKLKKGVGKVRTKDNLGALGRFCITVDGRTQIAASPPLIVPVRELYSDATLDQVQGALGGLLDAYGQSLPPERRVLLNQYRFVDIARKVVGVGSVGTRSWMILMLGRDEHDPLFLQAKEAGPSVLEQHLGPRRAGQRRGPRRHRPAGDADGRGHLPGLGAGQWHRRPGAGLLHPPAPRLEGLVRHRGLGSVGAGDVRRALRRDPGPGARPLG